MKKKNTCALVSKAVMKRGNGSTCFSRNKGKGAGILFLVMSSVAFFLPMIKGEDVVRPSAGMSMALPGNVPPPSCRYMDEQINRGVDYLLDTQNADGSWGKHGTTLSFAVLCEAPGGPLAFRIAVTSLDVLALCACSPDDPRVQVSLDKAEKWLLLSLPDLRQTDDITLLNIWGHSYAIQALCALSSRLAPDSHGYVALRAECRDQVDKLMKSSDGAGGWGYYLFNGSSRRPNGNPTSFCTATALLALRDAERCFQISGDSQIRNKAIKFLFNQRTKYGAYLYASELYMVPQMDANRHMGSLGRTVACNAALFSCGHTAISHQELVEGLETLWSRGGWLDMARKKPMPHESFAKNAGYFFYYGYFHAAESIEYLPPEERNRHYSFLARTLLPLQEKDGSWWDFPLYHYHKPYGTGFALHSLALARASLYGAKSI